MSVFCRRVTCGEGGSHAGGDRGPNYCSPHVQGTRYQAYLMLELFLVPWQTFAEGSPLLKVAHVYWHCPNSFQPPPTLCQTGTVGHFFRTLLFFSDGRHGIRKHLGCGVVEPDFTYIGMRKTALWTSNRLNPLRTNSWLLSPNREKKRAVGCLAGRKGSLDDSAVTCSLAQFGSQPPDLRKQLQGSTLFWLFWRQL